MLLVVSSLLVQALVNLANVPLGVDSRRILTARLDLPGGRRFARRQRQRGA